MTAKKKKKKWSLRGEHECTLSYCIPLMTEISCSRVYTLSALGVKTDRRGLGGLFINGRAHNFFRPVFSSDKKTINKMKNHILLKFGFFGWLFQVSTYNTKM